MLIDPQTPIASERERRRPVHRSGLPRLAAVDAVSPKLLVTALWVVVGCANLALLTLGPSSATQMLKVSGTTACGLAISLVLSVATSRLIARGRRRSVVVMIGLSLFGGAILWALDATIQAQTFDAKPWRWPSLASIIGLRLNLVYYELIFFLQTSALALLALQRTVQARERQLGEARLAAQQARLAALRFQLNPHFLFNTLNAISTLVGEARIADADEMIARLSGFLRTSLESDGVDLTPLEVELETIQSYLEIEAVRFGDRLDVRYACEAGLSDALVPSLILQPLVENAVKHAVAPAKTAVTVSISAALRGDSLVLAVEDEDAAADGGQIAAVHGGGVGLRNVAARLDALYGRDAGLKAGATAKGFAAHVTLPYRHTQAARRP